MPRQARLDAPGTGHHAILRGLERGQIVADAQDREAFVARLGALAAATGTMVYAWGPPPEPRPPAAPQWGPGAPAVHAPAARRRIARPGNPPTDPLRGVVRLASPRYCPSPGGWPVDRPRPLSHPSFRLTRCSPAAVCFIPSRPGRALRCPRDASRAARPKSKFLSLSLQGDVEIDT